MHNWWIAAFEHYGLITREEAEHIAENIKLAIHKENYKEAYNELEAILGEAKLDTLPVVKQLHDNIDKLQAEVEELKTKLTEKKKVVANTKKA